MSYLVSREVVLVNWWPSNCRVSMWHPVLAFTWTGVGGGLGSVDMTYVSGLCFLAAGFSMDVGVLPMSTLLIGELAAVSLPLSDGRSPSSSVLPWGQRTKFEGSSFRLCPAQLGSSSATYHFSILLS